MRFAEPLRSPSVSRVVVCALALATAGCSGDANRFDQQSFSNPFSSSRGPESTGSVPQYQRPAPNYVERQPLGQPQYQAQPQYQPQPQYQQPQYQQPAPQYQPPYQQSHYQQPAPPPPAARQDVTGSVSRPAPRPVVAQPQTSKNWDWNGGTPVTVRKGETIQTFSRRYGVPALAIAEANGMSTGTPIYPGQRLVIPKYGNGNSQVAAAAPHPAAQPQPAASAPLVTGSVRTPSAPAGQGKVHTVGPGETMYSIGRRYKVSPVAIAKANSLPPHHMVKMGERLTIPGVGGSRTATAMAQPAPVAAAAPRTTQPVAAAPQRVASAPQPRVAETQPVTNTARVITPAKDNPVDDSKADATETGSTSASGGFRWPARGRVIAGFGPKPTGQQNDGINLAVPEGTPIKASEDGVVAYAGNELKGYGNLVLVRHSNGYVTAYAHASELNVKRGETVKRGQVIGKSGQTGNVTSPQLHFEIRKGATPVDPMQHLASN
ncbi:LysM peptidoglycan-binding domain-containing M23 family metallopeptidase [Pseudorhodoplanes sinuspersici]|uniref:Uncharacterized protein n=1 Tax=Pseudorhodoplanes sinuspersici TaxID=1235591 RepID=A0A1W6ZWJ9_9HYPH|nr:LysM peptidoglycan-binding domain-containing M23 family metallopeptidase [Pseudorhodoplanes sinuspersici]ARQ01789.1 hypothetical protein CAK95_23850 [Pseudorhodoplanes sinuspersici]RKE73542.1 murein DD-endopeptidase MepM/ murein hydrolase activator NlpD [Pseudorhodoplanes sinuspersici]